MYCSTVGVISFDVSLPSAHIPFGLCVLLLAPRPLSEGAVLNTPLLDNSVPESKIKLIARFFITFCALLSALSVFPQL